MKIVIIIPTYNEAKNIGRMLDVLVLEELPQINEQSSRKNGKHKVEILVVDSKSPDGTGKIVRDKMKKYSRVKLLETEKGGLGADYVKGMKYAMNTLKADAIVEFDADFQHDPKDIKRLIETMDRTGADQVIGSRYIPGGGVPKVWGIERKAMSFFGGLFARVVLLINIHDLTSGFKLTKTKYLKKVDLDHLFSKQYAYKLHITHDLHKMGAKIVEHPIIFYERKEGVSKIARKDLVDSFMVVVRLRLKDSERFIKFAVVGLVGFAVNYLGLRIFSNQNFVLSLANSFSGLKSAGFAGVLAEPSAWAAALGAELAIVSNFVLNNYWTFSSKKVTDPFQFVNKFLQFNFGSLGAILIQFLVVGTIVRIFGSSELVKFIALVAAVGFFVIPYNYTIYNIFIWKTWKLPHLK